MIESIHQRQSRGREFNVVFLPPSKFLYATIAIVAYDQQADVTVTDRSIGGVQHVSVPAYSSLIMTVAPSLVVTYAGISNKVMHLIANHDISVTAYQATSGIQDGYTILPVIAYGLEYVTAHYSSSIFWGYVGVIAIMDDTFISIRTPKSVSIEGKNSDPNTPRNITLNKWQLLVFNDRSDLTGTLITSNKPIAVFGNMKLVQVPLGTVGADYFAAQFPAIEYRRNIEISWYQGLLK